MQAYHIILFIGIIQGLFLALTLLKTRGGLHNYFLSTLLFLYCIVLTHQYLVGTIWILDNIFFFYLSLSTPLLIGPCLYFYIRFILRINDKLSKKDILHFFPFALVIFYFLFEIITKDSVNYVRYQTEYIPSYITIIGTIKVVQWFAYGVYCYIMLFKFSSNFTINKQYQSILNWLYIFVIAYMVTWLVGMSAFVLGHFNYSFVPYLDNIPSLVLVLILYMVAYMAIKHPNIFIKAEIKKKYESSRLDSATKTEIISKLIKGMNKNKYYHKGNLKLNELASELGVSTHHLSQAVNEHFGLNFQEYLNSCRVDEVKERLVNSEYSNQTFLSIALDTGFNSKAVFNRAFKKFTGMTPFEYQKRNTSI